MCAPGDFRCLTGIAAASVRAAAERCSRPDDDARDVQLERVAFVALAGCLGLIQFTIRRRGPARRRRLVCWLVVTERNGCRVPAFFWPLVVLAAWTLVSSAFSSDPGESFLRAASCSLFDRAADGARRARTTRDARLNVIIALGAAGALVGIVQYAALGYDDLDHRPHGLLGHYMTYSGVLMLVLCAAAARLVFRGREWIWPAVAVPALLVALVVTSRATPGSARCSRSLRF